MNIVQFNNVEKQFLTETIFKDVSFSIDDKDKIGLVGLNGVGKSTIIKIILGSEKIDEGSVFVNSNTNISYLSQNPNFKDENNTVLEELNSVFSYEKEVYQKIQELNALVLIDNSHQKELEELNNIFIARDGYNIEYRVNQVLMGLELNNLQNHLIKNLSGGEKTRLSLAKLLLEEPELLILDEPTNHLDIASIEWLEEFLKKYNKAFLLVSHDRIFLDNVCTRIFEIENKKLHKYKGNFSDFILQKELIIKGELKAFEKEQEKIKKLEEYIERNRAGRMAKQAKGREKILNRIEQLDNPIFNSKRMKLKFEVKNPSNENVLEVKNISKSFEFKKVLKDISFKIFKGERIGIIGKNGSGKSTLLKIIADKIKADSGEILLGNRVKMAYYEQNNENLTKENTILQEINTSLDYKEEDLRKLAGAFLFPSEQVLKTIDSLSGGEKVRVSFLKIIQQEANFLLLDEPTNHLDIYSIEVLEDALENFEGSLLLVSHNRHFIDSICNTIYVLDDNGLTFFKGNYLEYKESLKNTNNVKKDESKKISYLEQKEKNRRINKLKKDIISIENRLEEITIKKEEENKKMFNSTISSNVGKLIEIQEKITKLDEEELNLLELWENYSKELEELDEIN